MSPLEGIRPSTQNEIALHSSRRNKSHREKGQRPENLELFQKVFSQIKESGHATLDFGIHDYVEANRISELLRAAFRKQNINAEMSIDDSLGKKTKLIIGLAINNP